MFCVPGTTVLYWYQEQSNTSPAIVRPLVSWFGFRTTAPFYIYVLETYTVHFYFLPADCKGKSGIRYTLFMVEIEYS
jgi:hypothetical protein